MFNDFDSILAFKLLSSKNVGIPLKVRILGVKYATLKRAKKFDVSDKIRKQVSDLGYQINDSKTFYTIGKNKI